MLEILLERYRKNLKENWLKVYLLAVFSWNLVIYSIPLSLLAYKIIVIPTELLVIFTSFIRLLLDPLEIRAEQLGNTLIINNCHFVMEQDCIGYKSILGFFAILFATPFVDYKQKARYFLVTAPILFIINIIRILSTISLYYYLNVNPWIVHNVLWGILTSFVVILTWYLFFKKHKNTIKDALYKTDFNHLQS